MARATTDVVIVGGGVTGAAAAYYLAKANLRAIIVERDHIAAHASGFAFGGLYPLAGAGIPGPAAALALRSFAMHQALSEVLPAESGIDTGFRLRPNLHLAFADAEATALQQGLAWLNQHPGFSAEWLDAKAARQVEPRIAPEALGATLCEGTAEVDAAAFTRALAQAAGAEVNRAEAVGVTRNGHGGLSVQLAEGGALACGALALTQGPWLTAGAQWLETSLPLTPLKGEIVRLAAAGAPVECAVSRRDCYATTKPDGLLWAGATEELAGFDETPSTSGRQALLDVVRQMLPSLADAGIVRHTACLRPMTPDGLPIVGPLPGADAVYVAGGGARKGILYAPALGKALADHIAEGKPAQDLAACSPSRFAA